MEHGHTRCRDPSCSLANPGQGRWGALLSHSPSAGVTRPQLYIPPRQCCSGTTFSFALFSFPKIKTLLHALAVLPTTLPQRHFSWKAPKKKKVMSKTASLSLLTEDRYRLTMPFHRKRKIHFPMKCAPATACPNPFFPSPARSTPETKLESLQFCPYFPCLEHT